MEDILKKRLFDDIRIVKQMQPALSAAYKVQADLLKSTSFAETTKAIQMVSASIVPSQGIFADLAFSRSIIDSFPALTNINIAPYLLKDLAAASSLLPDLRQIVVNQASVLSALKDLATPQIGLTLASISLTHVSLADLEWENIGKVVKVNDKFRNNLRNSFLTFSDSYFSLYQTLSQLNDGLTSFTPLITELPAIEFFNATELLEAITVDEPEFNLAVKKQGVKLEIATQTTDRLQTLLAELDIKLLRLWRGAIQSLESENEDRTRHVLISLRELLTHVIHRLASDKKIRAWSTNAAHFDEKGRPTRKARLLFICRNVDSGAFTTFLEKDIDAIISVWDILNRVHQLDVSFTKVHLITLRSRIECTLRLLLEVWKES